MPSKNPSYVETKRDSHHSQDRNESNKIENRETLGEFIRRSSRNSSILSPSERIPSILLDALTDDKKLLVKHARVFFLIFSNKFT